MPKQAPERVVVEAVLRFRHDGAYVTPGERVIMTQAEADELIAMGFARTPYKDRAMRASTR